VWLSARRTLTGSCVSGLLIKVLYYFPPQTRSGVGRPRNSKSDLLTKWSASYYQQCYLRCLKTSIKASKRSNSSSSSNSGSSSCPVSGKTPSQQSKAVSKTFVFVTLPHPLRITAFYAYQAVTKLIPISKYQYLTHSVSFGTLFVYA
jgi:hypothetical protein